MDPQFHKRLERQIEGLKSEGLYKEERLLTSPQQTHVTTASGREVLNLCSNNYLGLANHPKVILAAKEGLDHFGFGLSSVRFICGTQTQHKSLEKKIAHFLGFEDAILYSSCFDANGGLFETLFGPEDAIISDELNHASIIDGIRLCKAKRFRFANSDMSSLEGQLREAKDSRFRIIATDGVFSMDGSIANLPAICDLADQYKALVMVDDCHATGFLGEHGRGSPEYHGVENRIDILTSTLGKALGGASGGFTCGRKPIIDWLRQRSRPYLFSNALSPSVTAASLKVLDVIEQSHDLRKRLMDNTHHFRAQLEAAGFHLLPGHHPIIPIMLEDAALAGQFAEKLLEKGVYVVSFSYPVVPKGQARIRTQLSASHTTEDLDHAVDAFQEVGYELGILKAI